MLCPKCHRGQTCVFDSREEQGTIRRRRQCLKCGLRFTTYERMEAINLRVIKKDGKREIFERSKLLGGIKKSCEKRPIELCEIDKIIEKIETKLSQLGTKEVNSFEIGKLVLTELKSLDKVAYMRFASVHKQFDSLDDFEKELHKILKF